MAVSALAAVFVTMNLGLYTAIDRIGLGLAVTLEFLGPLTVALLGSRRIREIGLAVFAGVGVYVLILPGPASDCSASAPVCSPPPCGRLTS